MKQVRERKRGWGEKEGKVATSCVLAVTSSTKPYTTHRDTYTHLCEKRASMRRFMEGKLHLSPFQQFASLQAK